MADSKISALPAATTPIAGTEVTVLVQSGADVKLALTPANINALATASNLSDVASAATSRTNLGLGTAATQATTFFAQVANNLSDLASAATARTNLGLGTAATANTGTSGGTVPLLNGANTYSGVSTFTNGMIEPLRVITGAGTVTVAASDAIIVINKTVGAATAVSFNPSTVPVGQLITIKDGKGDAGANPITITPTTGTIDGAANFVMSIGYMSINIVNNGTELSVL